MRVSTNAFERSLTRLATTLSLQDNLGGGGRRIPINGVRLRPLIPVNVGLNDGSRERGRETEGIENTLYKVNKVSIHIPVYYGQT